MQLYSLRILVWLLALALPGVAEASGADDTVDFDALIASLCQKRVVLLGEDAGHGAGATVAVKGRIVEALVDRCGFDTLYFESPLYEFLDFEERQARGDAQPFHLADAIGPMWAGTREFEPTLHWLWPAWHGCADGRHLAAFFGTRVARAPRRPCGRRAQCMRSIAPPLDGMELY
jgi:erythromycin esterase-like protein